MISVLMIADELERVRELIPKLAEVGFSCAVVHGGGDAVEEIAERDPDLVLVAVDRSNAGAQTRDLPQLIKQKRNLPVLAIVPKADLNTLEKELAIDDFIAEPWDITEVALRLKRALHKSDDVDTEELIKCDNLLIDLPKCEVSVDGERIPLTFREYELVRFLASNRGRVFTRQTLLNSVWGYDYYGGDRTVDVHIRRLRSKIENSSHTFIETVRNVGYRFKTY